MTEAEWLNSRDLNGMLNVLEANGSQRKLRLFACACCRRIPGYLDSEPDRRGLELTELDVDGNTRVEEFDDLPEEPWDIRWYRRDGWDAVVRALESYRMSIWDSPGLQEVSTEEREQVSESATAELASLVREIFGNPFRPTSAIPSWLAWNDDALRKMAQAIYDDRAFDHLPLLADALEDAGCTDAGILGHCRTSGEHVRGCWVLDLLLGKE